MGQKTNPIGLRIALNRDWGLGWTVWQRSHAEQVAEAERLAYVAVTRARSQLLLLWARCAPSGMPTKKILGDFSQKITRSVRF